MDELYESDTHRLWLLGTDNVLTGDGLASPVQPATGV